MRSGVYFLLRITAIVIGKNKLLSQIAWDIAQAVSQIFNLLSQILANRLLLIVENVPVCSNCSKF
jgi:hypothetical protein